MKKWIELTAIAFCLYVAVGVGVSMLATDTDTKEMVWLAGAMIFALLVVLPWAVYGVFKLFLLTLYHTRKVWLQAAKDVKER